MAIPWATIKSLLIFFGPWLLPKAIGYYRQLQGEAARQRQRQQQRQQQGGNAAADDAERVRPLAWRPALAVAVLLAAAAGWLATSGVLSWVVPLPVPLASALTPENIFVATQSRLQAPTDVLFTRLAALRPGRQLTADDAALRARFASLESRLLYLQFGPRVLAECPFCSGPDGSAATAYLYYALADLAAGHLANLVLVALATSPLVVLGGRPASAAVPVAPVAAVAAAATSATSAATSADRAYDRAAAHIRRWRAPATAALAVLGLVDAFVLASYDSAANARATRLADLDGFFWTLRAVRGVACGALLAGLAAVLYRATTGRTGGVAGVLLFGPDTGLANSPAARVTAAARALAATKSKLSAGTIVKNTALRDAALRARTEAYWAREVLLVAAAMEEREVIEGVQDALQNRIDMAQIDRDAEAYAQSVLPPALTGHGDAAPDGGAA